jgi:protease I
MNNLKGKRVAVIATDGFEEVELKEPVKALCEAGATIEIISEKRDALRTNQKAQQFVRRMNAERKPMAVICHAPWLLVSAGLARG